MLVIVELPQSDMLVYGHRYMNKHIKPRFYFLDHPCALIYLCGFLGGEGLVVYEHEYMSCLRLFQKISNT